MRFLALLALFACSKQDALSSSDTLWTLTPKDARGAIVISAGGVGMIERGFVAVRTLFDSTPDLAPAKDKLAEIMGPFGTTLTLAEFGFSSGKGAALFMMKDGMVAALPVVDRDKFLAKVKGTKGEPNGVDKIDTTVCKMLRGYYVCATAEPLLATIGQGDLRKHITARGEIEIVGAELPFGPDPVVVSATIQLTRGAGTLRATVLHAPKDLVDRFTRSTKPEIDGLRTSGFAIGDVAALLPAVDAPMVEGVSIRELVATLDGLLSMTTPAGAAHVEWEQDLSDPAPMQRVIEKCDQLGQDAKFENGVCHVPYPAWQMDFDLWIDGKTLRIGKKAGAPLGKSVPVTPFGAELARSAWSFAFWGRGTMLAGPPQAGVEPVDLPAESAMVIRMMAMLTELGFGARKVGDKLEVVAHVRTLFANPDDVLAKIAAITAKDIAATRAGSLAEPIAKASPAAPFAHDFAAGHAGLLVPTALVGIGASFVVPALMRMREPPEPDE